MRYFGKPCISLGLSIFLFISILSVAPAWAQVFQGYTDVSDETGIDDFTNAALDGAALDFDRDGKTDLLMGAFEAAWRRTGKNSFGVPVFLDRSSTVLDGSSFPTNFGYVSIKGFIIADFDNDGYTDVFVPAHNYQEGHQLFRCDPSTNPPHYENVTVAAGLHSLGALYKASTGGAWADYDADGYIDLLLICPAHSPTVATQFLLHNVPDPTTGGRKFVNVNGSSSSGFVPVSEHVSSALWADYDGDHDMDLLLIQTDGFTKYFLNNLGHLYDVTEFALPDNSIWDFENHVSTVADVDNDGSLDIVHVDKEHIGYVSVQVSGGFPTLGLQWSTNWDNAVGMAPIDIAAYDYELDGDIDILAQDYLKVANFINDVWDGVEYAFPTLDEDSIEFIGLSGNGMNGLLATDFVEDGLTEIFVGRRPIDPFFFKQRYTVENTPPTNWVGVRLESIDGLNNFHGIGATVTLTAGAHTQAQIVDGGNANGQQRGLGLTFGLGEYTGNTANIEVKWPGGQVQNLVVETGVYTTIRNGPLTIAEATVAASTVYHLDTQTHDWVFECDIEGANDANSEFEVEFQLPIQPSSCVPDYIVLAEGAPANVTVTSTPTGSGWHYKLVWADTDCLPDCYIPFRVSCTDGSFFDESEIHNLRIKTCLGGQN